MIWRLNVHCSYEAKRYRQPAPLAPLPTYRCPPNALKRQKYKRKFKILRPRVSSPFAAFVFSGKKKTWKNKKISRNYIFFNRVAHSSLSTKAMTIASCSLRSAGAQLMKKNYWILWVPKTDPRLIFSAPLSLDPTVHVLLHVACCCSREIMWSMIRSLYIFFLS